MAHATGASRPARDNGMRVSRADSGLEIAQVADIQRARILSAMFDVACERGAGNVSVAHVVERSGVSRRTFYEVFNDREDCFLGAFGEAVSYASERVLAAYRSQEKWRDRIRVALIALLGFLDEEPVIGRLLIVESQDGGAATQQCRAQILAALTSAIERGRTLEGTPSGAQADEHAKTSLPPSLTGEGVIGGALAIIHSRLVDGNRGPLVELTNPLMSMIVLPYLGSAAARRELERPVPAQSKSRQSVALLSDPFKDAGMRLTYRTVRVLIAIVDNPGVSNRTAGLVAGIEDQGQISKLLSRLERIGLISNTGIGPGQGAPNAWTLTANGRQITDSIRAHTEDRRPGGGGRCAKGEVHQ